MEDNTDLIEDIKLVDRSGKLLRWEDVGAFRSEILFPCGDAGKLWESSGMYFGFIGPEEIRAAFFWIPARYGVEVEMKSSERIRYTGPALIEISESSKLSSLKPASHESDPPGPDAPQPETAQESSRAVKEYTADDVLQFIRYAPAMDGEWNDATPHQLIAAASQWLESLTT